MRVERLRVAYRDKTSALALELSQTDDATVRTAAARAQGNGPGAQSFSPTSSRASSQASSQASSGVDGRCAAKAMATPKAPGQ